MPVATRREARLLALLVSLLMLVVVVVLPSSAWAQTADDDDAATGPASVTWSVRPEDNDHGADRPNYQYDIAAGATISDALLVSNYSDEPISLAVYAADGFLNEAGQLDVLPADEESIELGAWVVLPQDEVTIEPGEGVRIPFRITVPPNAPPGDVVGAVVTSLRTASETDGVTVDRRLGSRILLRVDGDAAPQLEIADLVIDYDGSPWPWQPGSATLTYTLRNTGNITLDGAQSATFAGPFGLGTSEATGESFPPMPPGSELERQIVLEKVSPLVLVSGELTVAGANADLDAEVLRARTFTVWAVPWLVVAAVALVVALVIVSRVRRRARRQAEDRRVAAAVEAAIAQHAAQGTPAESSGAEPSDASSARTLSP